MQTSQKISISYVIVTGGLKDYLWDLLNSLKGQKVSFESETIVVSNSLDTDFNRRIAQVCPEAKVFLNGRNMFYCESLNKGIRASKGDFILCLNDDVILEKSFVEEALKGFSVDKKVGMVSGKIMRSDKRTIDSTGLFLTLWRTARERGYGSPDKGNFEKREYIYGVNGAVAFYRRQMLEQVKVCGEYFDRDFHIFYEDLDIAWRAQNLGWRGYYIPEALAYHVRGATVRRQEGIGKKYARAYLSPELHMDLVKNRYLAIVKNEYFISFLFCLPFIVFYDICVFGYTLIFRPHLFKKIIAARVPLKEAIQKRRLLRELKNGVPPG